MKKFIIHTVAWLGLVFIILGTYQIALTFEYVTKTLVFVMTYAFIFYASSALQAYHLKYKRYALYLLGLLALFFTGMFLVRVEAAMFNALTDVQMIWLPYKGVLRVVPWIVLGTWFQIAFARRQAASKLDKALLEKKETEIQFLKSQMNPHFFFNTLNNIYGLTYRKDDKAPKVVLMLSQAMRYILYETQNDMVPVHKEVEFLNNYIELERLRIPEPENICFTSQIRNGSSTIAPLLLLPFVENCFKHSDVSKAENSWIEIRLWEEGGMLCFSTENTFSAERAPQPGGIGMVNVAKRLRLIYEDSYDLETRAEETLYYVFLRLPLHNT